MALQKRSALLNNSSLIHQLDANWVSRLRAIERPDERMSRLKAGMQTCRTASRDMPGTSHACGLKPCVHLQSGFGNSFSQAAANGE